jgi:hypothetical protein
MPPASVSNPRNLTRLKACGRRVRKTIDPFSVLGDRSFNFAGLRVSLVVSQGRYVVVDLAVAKFPVSRNLGGLDTCSRNVDNRPAAGYALESGVFHWRLVDVALLYVDGTSAKWTA